MNERLKELIEECTDRHFSECVGGFETFDKEKFAELIVREMCQVMKAEGEQFSLDQNFDAVKGVGRCMRKVKEHFGVEE